MRFNTTCAPSEIRQGYQAYSTCNCSDSHPVLNCDRKSVGNSMKKPTILPLDKNRCILETTDLTTKELYRNIDLDFTVFIFPNLLSNDTIQNEKMLSRITSTIEKKNKNRTIILNLQSSLNQIGKSSPLLQLKNSKIVENTDYVTVDSVMLYSGALDTDISSRHIFTVNNTYIGVINNFKRFNFAKHLKWILDDARCLKKLGAYVIILMGDFSHELAYEMMKHLHTFVDVVIGIRSNTATFSEADSAHYHNNIVQFSEHMGTSHDLRHRIHLFQDNPHHLTYGMVHIRKSLDYRITLNRTTVAMKALEET